MGAANNDAAKVADFLLNEAGFDVVHVLTEEKVTRDRMRELMFTKIPKLVGNKGRFLFYWSGHGVTEKIDHKRFGHLVLANSKENSYHTMIAMNDITDWDQRIRGRHALYILDACFSGLVWPLPKSDRIKRTLLKEMSRQSRHIFTAGTDKEETIVLDDGSLFTTAILDGLRGNADSANEFPLDGIITVDELKSYVTKRVLRERQEKRWDKSIKPQLRDGTSNVGEFFFYDEEKRTIDPVEPTSTEDTVISKGTDAAPTVISKGNGTQTVDFRDYVAGFISTGLKPSNSASEISPYLEIDVNNNFKPLAFENQFTGATLRVKANKLNIRRNAGWDRIVGELRKGDCVKSVGEQILSKGTFWQKISHDEECSLNRDLGGSIPSPNSQGYLAVVESFPLFDLIEGGKAIKVNQPINLAKGNIIRAMRPLKFRKNLDETNRDFNTIHFGECIEVLSTPIDYESPQDKKTRKTIKARYLGSCSY